MTRARSTGTTPAVAASSAGAAPAPVTAIILTFNEERLLPACLESLNGLAEEIVIVDSGSTDSTLEIGRRFGARIVEHPFENYGAQRNWALRSLEIATPWVLNVDADERVSPELRGSIFRVLGGSDPGVDGFLVSRRTIFLGRWIRHGGHYPAWHLRLFRAGRGACEERRYDQHFLVDGPVVRLDGDLIDVLSPDLVSFVRKHLWSAVLEADEIEAREFAGRIRGRLGSGNPIEVRRWVRERYVRAPLFVRPIAYFIYRYVLRLGFLDGREGLIFHVLQGLWYRFVIDSLLFERRQRAGRPIQASHSTPSL